MFREGRGYRILEGRGTLLAMAERVLNSGGNKVCFSLSLVMDGGLRRTAFTPSDDILDTSDMVLVRGHEYGGDVAGKILIFKDDNLDLEIGPLLIT